MFESSRAHFRINKLRRFLSPEDHVDSFGNGPVESTAYNLVFYACSNRPEDNRGLIAVGRWSGK
jgi:hypothetical protein